MRYVVALVGLLLLTGCDSLGPDNSYVFELQEVEILDDHTGRFSSCTPSWQDSFMRLTPTNVTNNREEGRIEEHSDLVFHCDTETLDYSGYGEGTYILEHDNFIEVRDDRDRIMLVFLREGGGLIQAHPVSPAVIRLDFY